MLTINLFGQFNLRLEDEPVELPSRPAQTLLAYLLLNRTATHRRLRLAGLLWPDYPESSARQSLRNALWQLRQAIGDDYLLADRSSLAFNTAVPHTLDVAILEDETAVNDLDDLIRAVSMYEGDLLPGFYEDWILLERERLRALFERRAQTLLDGLEAAGRWREVQTWAERWIALGHVPEPAYQALMKAHATLGDQAGMATSYHRCVQALEEELGVAPSPETETLYKRLAEGDQSLVRPRQPAPPVALTSEEAQSTLPTYATPFVGRQEELGEIGRLLQEEPDCRLLTLVGPGGIGKTRLAIEAAGTVSFAHGAWFVPLASLGSGASLASAAADALRLRLHGSANAREHLLAYLRRRELLLILDNFEHLLSPLNARAEAGRRDVAALLTKLLEEAPRMKLLVTSRERLNLSAEWVFDVVGLQLPGLREGENGRDAADFSAVQLFLQRARQLKRDFGQDADELACVAQICRLAGGMPLAIELAAAWINVLSCREILQEIERNLSFLRTGLRDYPERHRDMRAVFDTSWKMLAAPERRLFRRLSVFRGGFTRAAAEAVGGEAVWMEEDLSLHPDGTLQLEQRRPGVLAALAGLVDKSFVRRTPDGRYEIHELIRQYGAAKLIEQPDEEREARDNHARYYLTFLVHHEASLTGPRQREILETVASEMENINVAWKRAIAREKLAAINDALGSYFNFCLTRSRLREGKEAFAHLVNHLQRSDHLRKRPLGNVILARASIRRAALCYLLGEYDDAWRWAEEGLALELGAEYRSDVAFAQIVLGVVAGWQGDRERAEMWLQKSMALSREIDDKENMADALHELAHLYSSFGDYAEAKRLAQESLDISRGYGRPDWVAHALDAFGWSAVCLGEYATAEACYRESLAIFETLGSQQGIANALGGLGWIAWCQGSDHLKQAREYCEQSLSIAREIGYRLFISNFLGDLALIANEQGDYAQAQEYSREGLRLAEEIDSSIYKSYHLCCLGGAACGRGDYEGGRRYLIEALQVATEVQLAPKINLILFHFAILLVKESGADSGLPANLQMKAQALELLEFVMGHPATWRAVRERAARLRNRLEGELPEDVTIAAVAEGKDSMLDGIVNKLLQPT